MHVYRCWCVCVCVCVCVCGWYYCDVCVCSRWCVCVVDIIVMCVFVDAVMCGLFYWNVCVCRCWRVFGSCPACCPSACLPTQTPCTPLLASHSTSACACPLGSHPRSERHRHTTCTVDPRGWFYWERPSTTLMGYGNIRRHNWVSGVCYSLTWLVQVSVTVLPGWFKCLLESYLAGSSVC